MFFQKHGLFLIFLLIVLEVTHINHAVYMMRKCHAIVGVYFIMI